MIEKKVYLIDIQKAQNKKFNEFFNVYLFGNPRRYA